MYYHLGSLLWMQYLHWDEGRPTPKPATTVFCSWIPGSRSNRKCPTVIPVSHLRIEGLPRLNREVKAKLNRGQRYNMKKGLDARYNLFGGDGKKWEMVNDPRFTSASRLGCLFGRLRLANGNKDNSESEGNN